MFEKLYTCPAQFNDDTYSLITVCSCNILAIVTSLSIVWTRKKPVPTLKTAPSCPQFAYMNKCSIFTLFCHLTPSFDKKGGQLRGISPDFSSAWNTIRTYLNGDLKMRIKKSLTLQINICEHFPIDLWPSKREVINIFNVIQGQCFICIKLLWCDFI